MKINKTSKLSELKEQFQNIYPGLKIEFYYKEHDDHAGSHVSVEINDNPMVSEISSDFEEGNINLYQGRTVAQVEKDFEELFGLHVQVFRKSKELWLQTISTDDWDLDTQNRKGIHSEENLKL